MSSAQVDRKDETVVALARPAPATQGSARVHSAFAPLLLGGLALLLMLGWQTVLLAGERSALLAGHAGQQQTVDNAGTLRAQLDALAADTQRLADAGNPNAALLVAELRKRGITINPAANQAANAASAAGK
jgi:hypothetical protein